MQFPVIAEKIKITKLRISINGSAIHDRETRWKNNKNI